MKKWVIVKNNLYYNDEFDVELRKWCNKIVSCKDKEKSINEFIKWYIDLYLKYYRNLDVMKYAKTEDLIKKLEWNIMNNVEIFEESLVKDRLYMQNLKDNPSRDQRKICYAKFNFTWYFSRLHPNFYDYKIFK